VSTNGAFGFALNLASPTAWPLFGCSLDTSALTVSTGRFGRLVAVSAMWTVRRVSVVRALSATSLAASGVPVGVVVAAAVPDVADVPDVVGDVSDFDPQPDTTSADSDATANAATAHDGLVRRDARREEMCACDIRSFMVSLCWVDPTGGDELDHLPRNRHPHTSAFAASSPDRIRRNLARGYAARTSFGLTDNRWLARLAKFPALAVAVALEHQTQPVQGEVTVVVLHGVQIG
jgi:hypothetical protein